MKNIFVQIKKGFTLAEVLITLVIIGVIAALTIPTAVNNYQKRQTVTQLKAVFSQFSQAAKMGTVTYGDIATWDFTLPIPDFFSRYLSNLVVVKEMTLNSDEIVYKGSNGGRESGLRCMSSGAKIKVLNSGALVFVPNGTHRQPSAQNQCFVVDVNGLKGPNQFGRDAFFLCVDAYNNAVIPHRYNDYELPPYTERSREQLINGPSNEGYQCNKTNGRGMWCAALIMRDGWQIKDDYPW